LFNREWKRIEWLVGRWEPSDESSAVVVEINKTAPGLRIRSFHKDDAEEYVVCKAKWDGKALSFEISVLSNKWRTRNCLKPISKNEAIQEITFWEPWKKVAVKASEQKGKQEDGWV
jgi:uncharacterized protein YggU (UPF0235/DUF167 family)